MLEHVQYSVYLIWSIYMQCYCWYCFALFPIDIVIYLKNCGWILLNEIQMKRETNTSTFLKAPFLLLFIWTFLYQWSVWWRYEICGGENKTFSLCESARNVFFCLFFFSLFVFHVQPHFQYIFTVIYLLVLLNINILCVFSITIKHIYFQMILFFIKAKMDFGLVSLFLSVHNSQLHALTLCPKCW